VSLEALMQQPVIRDSIANAIFLNNGTYWDDNGFRAHVNDVYVQHNAQSNETRAALHEKWNGKPLVGKIKVWDLLRLLHFAIDNTDRFLGYTSQFIHCLQVTNAIAHDPDPRFSDPADPSYREDMMVAALVHDFGKTLSIMGEADNNTDCMNRVISYGSKGLDDVKFQWNHDMMGHDKVSKAEYGLPQRVKDIVRFHSLRELAFLSPPKHRKRGKKHTLLASEIHQSKYGMTVLVDKGTVTSDEIHEFNERMSEADRRRAAFVQHFAGFDCGTKRKTLDIPETDVVRYKGLLNKYFPDGYIEW
jgi:hypothetical protein